MKRTWWLEWDHQALAIRLLTSHIPGATSMSRSHSRGIGAGNQATLDNGTPTGEVVPGSPPLNPFDPEQIRLGTNYADALNVQPAQLVIPVWSRPPTVPWFRVHPVNEVDLLMLDLGGMESEGG